MKPAVFATVLASLLTCSVLGTSFRVRYEAETFEGPFTGSVVVFVSKNLPEPRVGPSWTEPEPVFVANYSNIGPGRWMAINGETVVGGPKRLEDLLAGEYRVQAVLDRNLGTRPVGTGPGNIVSAPAKVRLGPGTDVVELVCDQVLPTPKFEETPQVKLVEVESKVLGDFHKRKVVLRAVVALPQKWSREREWPVVYEIPGFGGSYMWYSGLRFLPETVRAGEPFIHVVLDPDFPTGHHVFADSENNGPVGKALITELIPEIERRYRCGGASEARFLMGHSSGGWSSLWLQITCPEFFGGVWSTAPDYVDFRSFCNADIYRPNANFYVRNGQEIAGVREGDRVLATNREFCAREYGLRGEQMGSFLAVFSPRGKDGKPMPLWDWQTGAIDPKVAEAWRKYDISHILYRDWGKLRDKLKGKIFIACGEEDTFYLERPLRLLAMNLETLNTGATVLFVRGNHFTMMSPSLKARIDQEMADRYRAYRLSKASTVHNVGPSVD